MDWKYLLTSFEGRISRQPFWLSVLALFIAQWVIMIVAGMVFGFSMMGGMDPNMAPEEAAGVLRALDEGDQARIAPNAAHLLQ